MTDFQEGDKVIWNKDNKHYSNYESFTGTFLQMWSSQIALVVPDNMTHKTLGKCTEGYWRLLVSELTSIDNPSSQEPYYKVIRKIKQLDRKWATNKKDNPYAMLLLQR